MPTHRINLRTIDTIVVAAWGISQRKHTNGIDLRELPHQIKVDRDAPILLTPANGTPAGTLKPVLDWDVPVGPVTNYTIQVATSSTFGTLLVNSTTVDSTYTRLTNFPAGKTLYWRVKANGPNGPSAWSPTFSFTTP